MLKRQRPASPPLSSSNVPLLTDSSNLEAPNAKRRRTLPPVLDGKLRGWTTPSEPIDDGDDGYEDEDEDDGILHQQDHSTTFQYDHSPYKSTNNLLHELHTLNKHRLLFAPPQEPFHDPQSHMDVPQISYYPGSTSFQSQYTSKRVSDIPAAFESTEPAPQQKEMKESQSVRTRYEDTNR
ncbi:hypothetical protein D9758_002374 [Tetrapyrgos nigripes]|uniref:Uncharacterized protein n=1 Tax=Tetrapyrgos nigripes TaxID=182062 RepID=A0A8H5LT43_9AGAR|nr:hypothetical protein D9758_002374 [Tetrapyrgos nigripes]